MSDLFGYTKKRKLSTQKAHILDGGQDGVLFGCSKCKWESDWIQEAEEWSTTKILRGIDCPNCSKKKEKK